MALTDSQFTLTLASAALKLKLSGCMHVFVCLCAQRNDLQRGFDALPKELQPSLPPPPSVPAILGGEITSCTKENGDLE